MKLTAFIVCVFFGTVTLFMGVDKADKIGMRILNITAAIIFIAASIMLVYRGL